MKKLDKAGFICNTILSILYTCFVSQLFVVQFLPLIIFGVNLLLLFFAESLPAKI